jgi:predicted dehydrogenase
MRFAVIGLSHAHIFSMTQALSSVPGVECAGFCPEETPVATGFAGRFPELPRRSRADLLGDPAIDLVLCADVNGLRGSLLAAALKAGKHVFVDKPPVTTLEQLDAVRRATEDSGKLFFVYFGERLDNPLAVKARQLVREGRIGRTVNFIGLGPHKLSIEHRPAWMFDPDLYGGILNDIAVHQVELFSWLTGERVARFRSRVGNFATPQHPTFQDFGDAWFEGDGGTAGYVRVDWFTPDALPTWGDIRQMLVGSEGTLEIRNTVNIGSADPKPVLLLATRSTAPEAVDVTRVDVAWAPRLVADIRDGVNRLMPHEETFDALRAVLSMQQQAERAGLRTNQGR